MDVAGSSGDPVGMVRDTARGFAFTASFLSVCLAVVLVAQAFLPRSWVIERDTSETLWPQGWSFFTGDTLNSAIQTYRIGNREPLTFAPVEQHKASSAHLWGLNRTGEEQTIEINDLIRKIPDAYWQLCDRASLDS